MKSFREFLLLVLMVAGGCGPQGPHYAVYCTRSHEEQNLGIGSSDAVGFGMSSGGFGYHMGGGVYMVTETVCDAYDSTFVPADSGWVEEQEKKAHESLRTHKK